METVMHYPFIYFLYEPNQVLVYKIQTLDYITLANVLEKGEWEGMSFRHQSHLQHFGMNKEILKRDGLFGVRRNTLVIWSTLLMITLGIKE